MKPMIPLLAAALVLAASLALPGGAAAQGAVSPNNLRCEYRNNPVGIDVRQPRLSWTLDSSQRAQSQTAYQILAATAEDKLSTEKVDLWNSSKVVTDNTTAIAYAGNQLKSHQRVFWKVRTWDANDAFSAWSAPASFTVGMLEPSDWKAEWIGFDKERQGIGEIAREDNKPKKEENPKVVLPPVPYLRTTFEVGKPVRHATLYASALGITDVHLNGKLVSLERFTPGWTDYAKRVYSVAWNVTPLVQQGKNALGAVLADGWYSGYIGWFHQRNHYGLKPRVRAQLHLEYEDGTTADVATGPDWKAAYGPILEADFLMGETYDSRKAFPEWTTPEFDDAKWEQVATGAEVSPVIQAHPGVPVTAFEEIKPVEITQPKPGVWVLNMGQNFAGVVRLNVAGKEGQKITLRYAERLNPDGTIYTANLRGARATDSYICAGGGAETWQPRFTFHGFQYIEVTGLDTKPSEDVIIGLALSSATPPVGSFECNDPMLNRLFKNIVYTQRANYIDIPTDCPQRDERLGWTGDAQVYVRTAALICDVQAFFKKWLVDLEDAQGADGEFPNVAPVKVAFGGGGPAWADAGVICPWNIFDIYGDRQVLERHYESMKKFIDFNAARCKPGPLPPDKFHAYGDWLSIGADTPKDVIFMAYFAHSTQLVAGVAEYLGREEDNEKYTALWDQIRVSFQKAYVAEDGRIKGDTQAVYVLALANGLLTDRQARQAAKYLVADIAAKGWRLSTGFIGTKDLMLVLSKIGRPDVAYRLLHNDTFPSWGFSIKHGATSIWERWDGWTPDKGFQDPGMNSFAHYSFGAVYGWMAENIGGIRNANAGYKNLLIAPVPGGKLDTAKTTYRSIRGMIATEWKLTPGGKSYLAGRSTEQGVVKEEVTTDPKILTLNVTIPPNTTATILLPAENPGDVTEGGKPLEQAEGLQVVPAGIQHAIGNFIPVMVQAGSGRYAFTINRPFVVEMAGGAAAGQAGENK